MIFNIYTSILFMSNQFLLCISLLWFLNYSNYTLNIWDLYSRTLGNEFYVNLYYFLWTSFWYIPLFIGLIVVYQLTSRNYLKHTLCTLVIFFILYNTIFDLHLYWLFNTNPYSIPLKSEYYNNLLLNSINKYHPGLLYWSSLWVILYCFTTHLLTINFNSLFYTQQSEIKLLRSSIWAGLTLLVTLALGGWWALQEGSWGGWWNWDPSEVFGLIILIFFIALFHKNRNKQNFSKQWTEYLIMFLIILQVYFFTQLNFDLVSHNFGTKIDNFIDNTNLYTLIIIISYYYSVKLFLNAKYLYASMLVKNSIKLIYKFNMIRLYSLLIIFIFCYELLYSLIPLINDFLWKLFNVNLVNYVLIFEKYSLQLVFLIIIYFWKYNQLIFLYCIYFPYNYIINLLIHTQFTQRSSFFMHWSFIMFIWLSALTASYVFTEWSLIDSSFYNLLCITKTTSHQTVLNLNNLSLDYTLIQYLSTFLNLTWNTIWNDTTVEVYSFLYSLTHDISNQGMMLGGRIFPFIITINDVLSLNLLSSFMLLIVLYVMHFFWPKKIIF